jgi:hypothetical protein
MRVECTPLDPHRRPFVSNTLILIGVYNTNVTRENECIDILLFVCVNRNQRADVGKESRLSVVIVSNILFYFICSVYKRCFNAWTTMI